MNKPTKGRIALIARWTAEELGRRWGFSDNLCGMCAISSAALHKLFEEFGYRCEFIKGVYKDSQHCWVEDSDGYIWDVTATQFGKNRPKVVSVLKRDAEGYKPIDVVDEDRIDYIFKGWDNQTPDPAITSTFVSKALELLHK